MLPSVQKLHVCVEYTE